MGRFLSSYDKHNAAFGLDTKETAHVEIGQVTGAIVNTAPTAFWLVWQVLANPVVSKDCRDEINKLVTTSADGTHTIDLADVMTACPILVSTWQEVLRFHSTSIAARVIKEDTLVDNQYLLKKGGLLMMPNAVIHSDPTLWRPTVGQFNHRRFLKGKKNTCGPRGRCSSRRRGKEASAMVTSCVLAVTLLAHRSWHW